MAHERTKLELETELAEQISALRSSCRAFDNGDIWEAKRIASSLYILFYDGKGKTISLTSLLDIRKYIGLISSMEQFVIPEGGTVFNGSATPLLMMQLSDGKVDYKPTLGEFMEIRHHDWLAVDDWHEQCVFNPWSEVQLTRKQIIHTLRSQVGGAHVDAQISNEQFVRFLSDGDPGVRSVGGGIAFGISDPAQGKKNDGALPALVRQLGWEVDYSLQDFGL